MDVTFFAGSVKGEGPDEASLDFLVDSGSQYTLLPEEVWRRSGLSAQRTTHIDAVLRGPGGRGAAVRFLVDSGATYSLSVLADGITLDRGVSECHFTLEHGSSHSSVFQALPGAVTLENPGLVLNPFSRTLHPMRMLLA